MAITKLTKAIRKILPLPYCGAVIVAAGTASRMGGIDKVLASLGGEPLIVHTVRAFQNCDAIKEIVVVTREDLLEKIAELCLKFHDKLSSSATTYWFHRVPRRERFATDLDRPGRQHYNCSAPW